MLQKPVVCIGAALVDESFSCMYETVPASSNPAVYYRSAGGVARNVAHHLAQLGNRVELISHLGTDADGKWLFEKCASTGMGLSNCAINDLATGRYVAVLTPDGNLFVGAAATHFETTITVAFLQEKIKLLKSAALIQVDCNLSATCLDWLFDFSRNEKIPCVVDPVSVTKASRLRNSNLKNVLMITPNRDELAAITDHPLHTDLDSVIRGTLNRGIKQVWIRNGKAGSTIFTETNNYEHPASSVEIADVTGAGDAALAGWIHAYLDGMEINDCQRYGHAMADLIVQTKGAVMENLNRDVLESKILTTKK